MKKTISGHYGPVFSIEHNNRIFVPKNVDIIRTPRNYVLVAAGQEMCPGRVLPEHISVYWERYRHICNLYWEQRELYKQEELQKEREWLREMRRFFRLSYDPEVAFLQILLLPLFAPMLIATGACYYRTKKEIERKEFELWMRDIQFKQKKISMREALLEFDREHATSLLFDMDNLVTEMTVYDEEGMEIVAWAGEEEESMYEMSSPRFATIEEIYEKCFEQSFRRFQETQRPCRRFDGTYLEQIRERQGRENKTKGSRTEKSRTVAEAVEIVFGIGDKDTTGYRAAPHDAKKAEKLLKDLCDHLMRDPHLCFVTTKELNDPCWRPPFKHGLIVLNLVAHFDEATPGVHLTCIPYSRECKRGPDVQASLGRAMAGMGYPSTWKEVLGEDGKPVPKRDRNGNVILNPDDTIRYQQEPDRQGILDWIEEQKQWLSKEMKQRYGWEREYKGAHPRGYLTTPDYRVARALERLQETKRAIDEEIQNIELRVQGLTESLMRATSVNWDSAVEKDLILQYLMACPEEVYERLLEEAFLFLDKLPHEERRAALQSFEEMMREAQEKAEKENVEYERSTSRDISR